ncbi:MAG: hypothetical protein HYY24_27740 [Verrucomicrobia bacterium]|nr:hypothetical protein [Verrucomicrobiota bacterium]
MKHAQTIRIAALLVVIFVAGVTTGRLTAPRPPTLIPMSGGGVRTAEMVLARLTSEVGLDTTQELQLRPILEEMADEMARLPPATVERREIFRTYVPRIRTLLRPEQLEAFNRHVERTERLYDRMIRRRSNTP